MKERNGISTLLALECLPIAETAWAHTDVRIGHFYTLTLVGPSRNTSNLQHERSS